MSGAKYGISELDGANGQIQQYKSTLLSYNPVTGNKPDMQPIENCILWVDLSNVATTRPYDGLNLISTDTYASKLSSRLVDTPFFIYSEGRDILIYNKSTASITLPKNFRLKTPPIRGDSQSTMVGGGTETLSDYIDRIVGDLVPSEEDLKEYSQFKNLVGPLGQPVYVDSSGNTSYIWIPQDYSKPFSGAGWLFRGDNEAQPASLYNIASSIGPASYGFLYTMDMTPQLNAMITSAQTDLTNATANRDGNTRTIETTRENQQQLSVDLSNLHVSYMDAQKDIKNYIEFLYDAFVVSMESVGGTYSIVDIMTKNGRDEEAYKQRLAGYKTQYKNYLEDFNTRHSSHNYPLAVAQEGFSSFLVEGKLQASIVSTSGSGYQDYNALMYKTDMIQYEFDISKK